MATNWTGHRLQKDIRTTQVKQRRQGHQSIELEMRRHPILYNWRVSRGQLCQQQSQLQSGCQLSTVNAKCASGSFWSLFFQLSKLLYVCSCSCSYLPIAAWKPKGSNPHKMSKDQIDRHLPGYIFLFFELLWVSVAFPCFRKRP